MAVAWRLGICLFVGGGEWLPVHHLFFLFPSLAKLFLSWPTSFLTYALPILSSGHWRGAEESKWVGVLGFGCWLGSTHDRVKIIISPSTHRTDLLIPLACGWTGEGVLYSFSDTNTHPVHALQKTTAVLSNWTSFLTWHKLISPLFTTYSN